MARRTRMPPSRPPESPEEQRWRDELFTAFGIKVRMARRAAGLSQAQLAEMSGVAQSYIYEIESAGGNLSLEGVAKLAKCLKISMKDLMPDNEFDTVITSTGVVSAFDRAVEALQQAASALLSEVRGLTEFRERIERLVRNEPGQPDK